MKIIGFFLGFIVLFYDIGAMQAPSHMRETLSNIYYSETH